MSLKIGSRQSHLAKFQAYAVEEAIHQTSPDIPTDFYFKPSMGDLNLDMDLSKTQSKGVFTSDFLELLKNKTCDMVVHSWKDLPIEENEFTTVCGTLPREDSRDLLFIKQKALKKSKIKILTSSPRREFNIRNFYSYLDPSVEVSYKEIRGNIPTRFKKFLEDSEADGFSVAVAAVKRLVGSEDFNQDYPGIWKQILKESKWAVLPESLCPSAPAQGAFAVEVLKENQKVQEVVSRFNDQDTKDCIEEERRILKKYGGGCHLALGATVLKTAFGKIIFEAGHVDQKTIKKVDFIPTQPYPKLSLQKVWISSEQASAERTREEAARPEGLNSFMVTRAEALPDGFVNPEQDNVFVSGLRTWKKLYDQGLWVSGSLDSLGEDFFVDDLFGEGRQKHWLTRKGVQGPENFKTLHTYSVKPSVDPSSFEGHQAFVWMSGEFFVENLKKHTWLQDFPHFFGLGRSIQTAMKYVKEQGLDVQLHAFYNLEQLKKSLKNQ